MTSTPEPRQPDRPSDPWGMPHFDEPPAPDPFPTAIQPGPIQPGPIQPVSPTGALVPIGQPGPVIVQIGEIAVTSTTVHTPAGDLPLAGSTWHVTDYWHNEQKIPTWAIVMSIVGFCFLTFFSLLFLLAKETIYRGTVQVTVTNGPRQYVARIPVTDQTQVAHLHQQANYVRSLAAL